MSTSILTIIDTRRVKMDKTFPIVFRIIHNRKSTTINTGYSVLKTNWNNKSLTVKRSCIGIPNVSLFNSLLKQRESEMRDVLMKLEHEGNLTHFSIKELKDLLLKKSKYKGISFVEYANSVIKTLRTEERIGTANSYQEALNFVIRYSKHSDLPFPWLSVGMLNKLETKYMSNPSRHFNGLAVYMRSIRAIYNRAIIDKIVKPESYPFSRGVYDQNKYRIKTEKTKKRAVGKEDILAIEEFAFKTEKEVYKKYLFYFLFSFYLRGMNFADIAKLRVSSVSNNHIEYRRSKTKRVFEIKLGEKAWAIINYFGYRDKSSNDYLFPIITRNTAEGIKKDIKNGTRNTNKYLKKVSEKLELNVKLTTYVSRHSWATIADKAGIDRRIISKGLGHADLQTTDIYIADIVSNEDLSAADKIISG